MRIDLFFIPTILVGIILYAMFHHVNLFESFLKGAKEGVSIAVGLIPTMVGLLAAIAMLQASGAIDLLTSFLAPLAKALGIPQEILPLAILKPVSGSGSLAVCETIFTQFHPDSYIGRVAAVLQGSTETTFYTIAVYYSSVGVSNIRYTLPTALFGDLIGIVCSSLFVRILFGVH
ncbi:spore maturation protein [Massilioclostridium coli]|uniref:spore maturation protein n=1 Tax=Massilioclostridium coli TaxID=1870991 RepID=UPI00085C7DF8|nr:nucleoside recognition domain-containing protein [Massilioclostridium coli]